MTSIPRITPATAQPEPRVRAVRVVRPYGGLLTYADVRAPIPAGSAVVVELDDADYDQAAVITLASLAAAGHPVDIRGTGRELELARDIERQIPRAPATPNPLPWETS